jgi:hypothetical protein
MQSRGSHRGGKELILELQLLDALVPLPRDAALTLQATSGAADQVDAALLQSKLLVLVSHAENLPTVRGCVTGLEPPDMHSLATHLAASS